jgi:hypothetical protein
VPKPLQLVEPLMKPMSEREENARAAQNPPAIVVRLREMPATPGNLDRIRNRVHELNRELAHAGAPFRVRLM